ncbi:DUF4357 domain-containing protein [Aquitalea sp. FJL05]|uniref:GIY-YIG nuclease family protein n=1 Tax=Aquitalea sp. FJL05 TaxID=2153366 RepID=UPI000F5A7014|nr:GIY-YIG nuclease family protein [Aquitalea sp. FJL05]RQO78390.1 DUF4357 domain-containing protein [Aquitalea sp. FJL05]
MNHGKSIRMFLVDGTPGGIITAEIINWTGHVISAPRSRLADVLKRAEASRPGLYVLVGDNPADSDSRQAYIGESEVVGERLAQHNKPESTGGKDFWDRMFIFTSKDANLTKGHLRYVESKLISIASHAGRLSVANVKGKQNEYGVLPEADMADMHYLIEQLQIVLPALGLDLLRAVPAQAATTQPSEQDSSVQSPVFSITTRQGISATAQEIDGEFIVRKGSLARGQWENEKWVNYKKLHQSLQEAKKLVPTDNGMLVFSEDCPFNSPSAAAAIVLARNANGRIEWKLKDSGQSYTDWQDAQLVDM